MENWEDWFQPHILDRGWNYYESGAVKELIKTEDGYSAVVEGTEDYNVEIILKKETILDMYCDCPYAEKGNYCKHMAAVLYEAKEQTDSYHADIEKKEENTKERYLQAAENISEEELRKIIVKMAQKDEVFGSWLLTKYEPISEERVRELEKRAEEIGEEYSDQEGCIYYRSTIDYTEELMEILHTQIAPLLEREYYWEAFRIVNSVFLEIETRPLEDNEDLAWEVEAECYSYWTDILAANDEKGKEKMYQWFRYQEQKYKGQSLGNVVRGFLINEFHDEETLKREMEDLDEEICKEAASRNGDNFLEHNLVINVNRRIHIMEQLGYSKNEMREYRSQFRKYSEIRALEIQEYLNEGQMEEAAAVLKESKKADKDKPGLVKEYSVKLLNIYRKLGLEEEYKQELIFQVFQCRQLDIKYMTELKKRCEKAEWEKYRDDILNNSKSAQIRLELMEEEKFYEKMMSEVEHCGYIFLMDKYEKCLREYFPERVRDLYIRYVQGRAVRTSDRNIYRELAGYLKKITQYPDGVQKAQDIADQWKNQYKNRRAMIDELKKAGF